MINFKVGLDGDVNPTDSAFAGLVAYDRDRSGTVIQCNSTAGNSGFINPADASALGIACATQPGGFTAPVMTYLPYVRSDGFAGLPVQINGVRAYDPKLGNWTTPDAYEGDVHDPASQQRYMWNRNNPYEYSDPSGFQSIPQNEERAIEADLVNMRIMDRVNVREMLDKAYARFHSPDAKGGTYSLRATSGTVVRNGRTSDLQARAGAHARGFQGLKFKVEFRTDDKAAQRGLEQRQLETQPGILDKINGISPKNLQKGEFEQAARDFLQTLQRGY